MIQSIENAAHSWNEQHLKWMLEMIQSIENAAHSWNAKKLANEVKRVVMSLFSGFSEKVRSDQAFVQGELFWQKYKNPPKSTAKSNCVDEIL